MSTSTLAPSVPNSASVSAAPAADPSTRTDKRLAAEQALSDLERAVQRLSQRFFAPTTPPRRTIPRRARRSAWLPSN